MVKLRNVIGTALLAGVLGAFGSTGPQQASQIQPDNQNLTVSGDIPSSMTFTKDDLDKLPQESETVQEDGARVKYVGVTLRSLLEKAGAPAGKAMRGKALAGYVLAKARDDYQVVFSMGELDPNFGNERVLVVYKRDGKSLFGYQGPYRILCPNDRAGARSVRMLASLEVVRLRK
jgi:DMSO/TMAO reductase YedYZ molybdopterin-dependent catalytic subunit